MSGLGFCWSLSLLWFDHLPFVVGIWFGWFLFSFCFFAFVVWRQLSGTRCSAHVLRIWPKPNPPPLLRYASRAAKLTPARASWHSVIQSFFHSVRQVFKLVTRKCLGVCTAERSKGGGFGLPKPEDMSGAVRTPKHLHRQLSRVTSPWPNQNH